MPKLITKEKEQHKIETVELHKGKDAVTIRFTNGNLLYLKDVKLAIHTYGPF